MRMARRFDATIAGRQAVLIKHLASYRLRRCRLLGSMHSM
jgi:hypothetical protein